MFIVIMITQILLSIDRYAETLINGISTRSDGHSHSAFDRTVPFSKSNGVTKCGLIRLEGAFEKDLCSVNRIRRLRRSLFPMGLTNVSPLTHSSTNISYSYVFEFEKRFVHYETRKWMIDNWTWGFLYCAIYFILIFSVQYWMRFRPKFQLDVPLAIWNFFLACFSIMGSIRTLPEFVNSLTEYGFYHSVCVPRYIEMDKVSGFWTYMFTLSKLPELGDSIFIVLRKRPLIFLHYYHHATVLLYTWFTYTEYIATARWFIVMNYCVHSCMYSYFALKSMNIFVPRFFAKSITLFQLLQMLIGFIVNLLALYFVRVEKRLCQTTMLNIQLSTAMYLSYFYLFAQFFYQAYYGAKHKADRVFQKIKTKQR